MQFFDSNGDPLSGGKLYTYSAGTTTPKATYTDEGGATSNANPVVLDSAGRAVVFLTGSYKFRLEDSLGNLIRETDNVTAFSVQSSTVDNIIANFTEDVIVAADSVIFSDASDSNTTKRDTVQGIIDLVTPSIPTITSWASPTTDPTITNAGTVVTKAWKYRRVGDSIHLRGWFVIASNPASLLQLGMPDSLTMDTTKLPYNGTRTAYVGAAGCDSGLTSTLVAVVVSGENVIKFALTSNGANSGIASTGPVNTAAFGVGVSVYVDVIVPISGW